jgi:hypothetical protein
MLENLMLRRSAFSYVGSDPNADNVLAALSAGQTVGQMVTRNASVPSGATSGDQILGYWKGKFYVAAGQDLKVYNPQNAMAMESYTLNGYITMGLNSSVYLRGRYLYAGMGRLSNSRVIRLDMESRSYVVYPATPMQYAAVYADDTYCWLLGGVNASGVVKNTVYRCLHGGSSWEAVAVNGAFTHGHSGSEATLVGRRVYLTGGGATTTTSSQPDGSDYTDINYLDLDTMTVGKVTLGAPGMTAAYNNPSTVWKDRIYQIVYQSLPRSWDINGGAVNTSWGVTPSGMSYHNPSIRVGDLLFYLQYSRDGIYAMKLPGGL